MPEIANVPDEYLIAIGKVTVLWNHLEQLLNLFLIHLLGSDIMDDRHRIVFIHMAFPQKLDVLGALAEEAGLGEYKTIVVPVLKKAADGRNSVIHSVWGVRNGIVMKASIKARGSLKFSWLPASLNDIESVNQSIHKARVCLYELANPAWLEAIRRHKRDNSDRDDL